MANIMRVGGGAGGGANVIEVYVDSGAIVTAVSESGKSYTATSVDGLASIKVSEAGLYTVTANVDGAITTETIEVTDTFEVKINAVYGISRDITASSPEWARTDSAEGLSATASVGVVAGASDFDNIYPWRDIKRETLSTGDVMVKIPKFYFARYREGNIEYIKISGNPKGGFSLHPAFNHGGVEKDCIYVGAYKAGIDKTVSSKWKATSKSGVAPMTDGTRNQFRLWAKAKGNGWSLIDISTISAIQMLYLVEYANNNSQAMIGRGHVDSNSAALNTGSCDVVPNLTGRPAGTDGKTDIVYRGIEGLWGNIWEWVDGVNLNGGTYYVCNDPSKYKDDTPENYTALSFQGATSWVGSYINRQVLDTGDNEHVMLPQYAGSGSETTLYCDACWSNTGWRVFMHGGTWDNGSRCGMFTANLYSASSYSAAYIGSRLLYIPS